MGDRGAASLTSGDESLLTFRPCRQACWRTRPRLIPLPSPLKLGTQQARPSRGHRDLSVVTLDLEVALIVVSVSPIT